MLIPLPEGNLDDSTLVRGATILAAIREQGGSIVVEDAMLKFLKLHPTSQADDFMDCLCVLYAIGAIEFDEFRLSAKGSSND